MNYISFIPENQKNIYLSVNKSNKFIIWLVGLFIIYIVSIGASYWFVLLREQSKIDALIAELDEKNSSYYPKDINIEQTLFNLNDLINNSYDPIPVVNSIESAYLPNAIISNFIYNKTNKIISISMNVPSINDVNSQIQKFSSIEGVSKVDFNSINSSKENSQVLFGVEIKLK